MPPSTITTQPTDYSKATLNPQFQAKVPQISQTIQQLRSQKIPDEKIFSYLQQKGVIQIPNPPAPPQKPQNMGQRMGADVKNAGENVYNDITGGGNPVVSGFKAASDATTGVMKTASEVLPSPVRQGLGAVNDVAGGVVNWLGDKLGSTKLAQDFVTKHPDAAKTLENMASVGNSAGNIAGGILTADAAAKVGNATVSAGKGLVSKTADAISNIGKTEPTITVGGKALSLDDIHSNTDFVKSLSPADQKAVANFDQHYSLINQVEDMKAKGQDISDFQDEYNKRLNSTPEIPKGSAAKISGEADPELQKIQDTIAPKLNKTETQAALEDSRVTRGKDSFLFGKQPDTVIPSDEVVQASRTIKSNIPGASKMTDAELTNAINDHIEMTSQNLAQDMENIPVKDETLSKVNETWQNLKAEQASSPEFLDNEAGNKAFQGKFENYLKQAQDAKNLNDVWDARKEYDNSIPRNVKQATEASSPNLQTRKAMWLDNRGILNSMVHDTANGMGEESKQAFSGMSDMYSAKQNILSKVKIDIKGASGGTPGIMGKVKGFVNRHPYVSGAIGAGVADKALKETTGIGL